MRYSMRKTQPFATKPHIFFLVKDLGYFNSHRNDLAKYLRNMGLDISLACDLSGPAERGKNPPDMDILNIPFTALTSKPWRLIAPLIKLLFKLSKTPNCTIFSVTVPATLLGGTLCRLLGIRHVVLIAGLGNIYHGQQNFFRRLARQLLKFTICKSKTRIICQNNNIEEILCREGFTCPITVIPGSGIDEKKFAHFENREIMKSTPTILMMSRLLVEKGVIEFIESTRELHNAGYAAQFVLAGRVDEMNPTSLGVKQLSKLISGIPNLEWIGNNLDVTNLLQKADIVCLPSYHEGLPRALLEGALAGCCLVGSDIPGITSIIKHNETGILVTARSVHSLADGLKTLLDDHTHTRRLAKSGQRFVLANFINDKVLPEYAKVVLDDWEQEALHYI